MRFLLDANLFPNLLTALVAVGHVARHVDEIGLLGPPTPRSSIGPPPMVTCSSPRTLTCARLAARGSASPSVVLVRHVADLPWHEHQALLMANLPAVLADLQQGAIVSLSPTRLAVRSLPIDGGLWPHLFPNGCPSQVEIACGIAHGALSTTWKVSSSAGWGRQTRQYEMSVAGPVNSHDHGRPGG